MFFYALLLLCQLACFIITVYVGQLLVHFVPCCPAQVPYVKRSCRCDYLFEQMNDMIYDTIYVHLMKENNNTLVSVRGRERMVLP